MIIPRNRELDDGIYDVTGLAFLDAKYSIRVKNCDELVVVKMENDDGKYDAIIKFIETYPEFSVAAAYQTDYCILFASLPPKANLLDHVGSGFNYGSTNLLRGCPSDLLILAEDD